MTPLSLLVLGLLALLVPGHLQVDVDNLKDVVTELVTRFHPVVPGSIPPKVPTFSLAVKVPQGSRQGRYDASRVPDDPETVKKVLMRQRDVYVSPTMVAATVLKHVDRRHSRVQPAIFGHAEDRVLQKFHLQAQDPELMVFFCSSSPCNRVCTNERNPYNILQSVRRIRAWEYYALVFDKIFHPKDQEKPMSRDEMTVSLNNLRRSIGRRNIYRCNNTKCVQCFKRDNKLERFCVQD